MLKTLAAALIATSVMAVPVLAAQGTKDQTPVATAPVAKVHTKHVARHHVRHPVRHVMKHKHHVVKTKHHHVAKVTPASKPSKLDR